MASDGEPTKNVQLSSSPNTFIVSSALLSSNKVAAKPATPYVQSSSGVDHPLLLTPAHHHIESVMFEADVMSASHHQN